MLLALASVWLAPALQRRFGSVPVALGGLSTWGVEFDGLFVLPALIGGLVVGFIVDALSRYTTEGSYTREPRPI